MERLRGRCLAVNGVDVEHECLRRGVTSRTATDTPSRVTADSVKEKTGYSTAVHPTTERCKFTNSGYSELRLMYTSSRCP
jgi:hypothetical protein